ncbi:unnamed protein product [Malus baccata var. baccata]
MEVVFGKKKRKRNKGLIGPGGVIAPGVEIIELVSHPEEFEGNGEIIEVVQQERDIDLNIPILEVGKEEFARVLGGPGAGGGVEQGSLSQDSDPFNHLPSLRLLCLHVGVVYMADLMHIISCTIFARSSIG